MFGWEFPPHISGGLGTACYGLTKGLRTFEDIEIIFVVPKRHGDEDENIGKIIGASEISVKQHKINLKDVYTQKTRKVVTEKIVQTETIEEVELVNETVTEETHTDFTYVEVASLLTPYLTPEQFERVVKKKNLDASKVYINRDGQLVYAEEGEEIEVKLEYTDIVETDEQGKYNFSGKYGDNLMEEVTKYAEIAAIIAQEYDFDVIHAHDWLTYLAGIAAKRIKNKPLVIHVHATEFDRSGESVNQRVYDIERLGMEVADKIITVSNLTKNIVVNRYGQNADKVVTVYNAVEFTTTKDTTQYKKTFDEKIVTFLGRVTFQKGPEYFVEAAYKVLQKVDNVKFVMAGSGDLLRKMIRRTAELGISDRFHYTDFLKGDDVKRMFAISDVYVMPSVSEPFGISPLEAMQSNVPVIISKQSGVAEILKHALKIDFWDVDAMADAIYGLLNYEALSKMFSRYGKQEVDNLKWENAAKNVRDVYLSALNK